MADNLLASKPSSQPKARLNHLDVYKGICIIFIILTHYSWTDQQRLLFGFPFWIDMAVPIFMVITGYVSSLSFERKQMSLKDIFKPKEIMCKWFRFIIPFIPVWLIQVFFTLIQGDTIALWELLSIFLTGGAGPGAYYFPVMLQVVFIFPLIWYVISNSGETGIVACFGVNLLFEVIKTVIAMPAWLYRLCALRYIFVLAYGAYLFEMKEASFKKRYLAVAFFGVVYIVIFNYTTLNPIITNQWRTTSLFAVLYIIPIMWFLIERGRAKSTVLELIGRASYNIFLVQMIYYAYVSGKIYGWIGPASIRAIFNIVFCVIIGVIFYVIEYPITSSIIKQIRSV